MIFKLSSTVEGLRGFCYDIDSKNGPNTLM